MSFVDRNIVKRIAVFVLMRLWAILAVSLAAHGVPGDLLEQVIAAAVALLGLVVDIVWSYIDRQKAKAGAVRSLLEAQGKTDLDREWWEVFEKTGH